MTGPTLPGMTVEETLKKVFFETLDKIDRLDPAKQDKDEMTSALLNISFKGMMFYATLKEQGSLPKEVQFTAFIDRYMAIKDKFLG